jgi:putative ABC transport system permease protein
MLFKIAVRNILRNARRSAMTMAAIAVGAIAMILFGGFMNNVVTAVETDTVDQIGHLAVFRAGYIDYGAGNPAAYGIGDYQGVMKLIGDDPVLKPMLNVLTPTITLFGIAGNFDIDASKTFLGSGFIPSDRDRMRAWDQHDIFYDRVLPDSGMRDNLETVGVIGVGLARVLGPCERLGLTHCPPPPLAAPATEAPVAPDIAELAARDRDPTRGAENGGMPRLDLLAATAGGAPNVLSLFVSRAESQGVKELDDSYIAMHFTLAQKLLYGRGEPKALSIVLQLHRTEDVAAARARLVALFREHGLDLDVRDFVELFPFYTQVIGMFGAIFSFIAVIMVVIVLFTVVNTMSMSVMERTNEIGTARALGVRRRGIRRQFLLEGCLLGVVGAVLGVILAVAVGYLVNHSGMTWLPPGRSAPVPLRVMISPFGTLTIGVWIGLVAMATFAALIPANRAARLPVVDALRHV